MKTVKFTPEEIVSQVLTRQGYDAGIGTVKGWLNGQESPPQDIIEVVESVIQNLPYHIRAFEAEATWSDGVGHEAVRRTVQTPSHIRGRVSTRQDASLNAHKTITVKEIHLTKRSHDAFVSMCRVCKLSRTSMIQSIVQNAINVVMEASKVDQDEVQEAYEDKKFDHYEIKQKDKFTSQQMVSRTVKHVKSMKKKS